jgi:pyridoxal phosphate enzyme (YggS family)
MSEVSERYSVVSNKISSACQKHGRDLAEITLIAVTKNHPAELVRELYDLGVRNFGENRDQEGSPKAAATKDLIDSHWHFIGQLQSNKVKSVLGYSQTIHSIDRPSLVEALAKALKERFEPISGFIQLNLTEDDNRGGLRPDALLGFAESLLALENFKLLGVMGVAALDRDPRIDFEVIASASGQLRTLAPDAKSISAGMSHDFEQAIEFGATHLRIGSAITENRNP